MAIDYRVANDNVPKQGSPVRERSIPEGMTLAGNALRARAYKPNANEAESLTLSAPDRLMNYSPVWSARDNHAAGSRAVNFGVKASALGWVASAAAAAWAIYSGAPGMFHLIAIIALLWSSVALGYFMSRKESRAGVELSALSALLAFGGSIYVIAAQFGILAPPPLSAAIMATGALALGFVLRSKVCLRLSAILGLAWLAACVVSGGMTALFAAIPVFAAAAALIAASQDDEAAFNLSHLLGYGWIAAALALTVTGGILAAHHAVALFFATAATEHRIGRLLQDKARPLGEPMSAWGWALSMGALIGLTDFWLRGDAMPWSMNALDPLGLALFMGLAMTALVVILFTEIRRVVTRPQSPALALCVSVIFAAAILSPLYAPMAANMPMASLADIGLTSSQGMGLLFAGAAFALSCIYAVNGARRVQPLRVIMGLAALIALAVVALDHLLITPEALLIFGASAFVSILVAIAFIKPRD